MTAGAAAVVVVGSLNTDYLLRVDELPAEGETVAGTDYLVAAGGKGLNQAVAAARQGVAVAFVGCVGADAAGQALLELLAGSGVDVRHVRVVEGSPTGVALVTVAAGGANTIVVAPLANGLLSPADVEVAGPVIDGAAVLLAQMEVPAAAVSAALTRARSAGVVTVLNPAPARGPLPASLVGLVDILIPNESEAAALTGGLAGDAAALALVRGGASSVIVTLGSEGAVMAGGGAGGGRRGGAGAVGSVERIAAFPVDAVDTTGAGDAFCGVLAAAIAGGAPLSDGIWRASAAGALAATVVGAVPSLPAAAEIDRFLRCRPVR